MPSRFKEPVIPMKPSEARAITKLEAMRKGDPLGDATWRRPGGDLATKLRSLSDTETTQCYAAAIAFFEDEKINLEKYGPYVSDAFEDEVKLQILFRACRDPEDPAKSFADDPADLRDHTTPIERAVMMLAYNDHVKAVDRSVRVFTPEVAAAVRDAIKKKDASTLNAFGSYVLASYLLSTESPSSPSTTTSAESSP